jgi:hypothetical protein
VSVVRAQGIILEPGRVDRSFWSVNIVDSHFAVATSPDLKGTIGQLTLRVFSNRAAAQGVRVRLEGEPLTVFEAWSRWQRSARAVDVPWSLRVPLRNPWIRQLAAARPGPGQQHPPPRVARLGSSCVDRSAFP